MASILIQPTTAPPNVVDWKLNSAGVMTAQPIIELHHTAIIKDGDGKLVIDRSLDMAQCFVVREGEVTIENSTITNTANSHASASLTVAGKNASLILDGATYTEQPYAANSHTNGIVVGGTDGDGSLTLTNSSTLATGVDSYLIIGHSSWPSASFQLGQSQADLILNCGTYRDVSSTAEDANRYRDKSCFSDPYEAQNDGEDKGMYNSTGHLTVEHGSQVTAGRIWALNSTITVSGEGSLITDILNNGTQNTFGEAFMNDRGESMVQTTITIQDGGRMELNNRLTMASWSGKTVLNVQGEGSTFISNDYTIAIYNYANNYSDMGGSKQVEINVTDGAHAHFSSLNMGMQPNNGSDTHATAVIDESSSYTGGLLGAQGSTITFTNRGKTEIGAYAVSGDATQNRTPIVQFLYGATFTNTEGATLTLNNDQATAEG